MRWKLRIHLRYMSSLQLLTLAAFLILALAAFSNLFYSKARAAISAQQSSLSADFIRRRFYLTKGTYGGANALYACQSGYHMASLWEILDTTQLEYNSVLGYERADDGSGPPTFRLGWIRTGWDNSTSSTAGLGNCNVWTNGSTGSGTVAQLPSSWAPGNVVLHVWDASTQSCSSVHHVWCVADQIGFPLYLPLVKRN